MSFIPPTPDPEMNIRYVAPKEPPPPRRPPIRDVGLVGWLRVNLFSDLSNSIATVITLGVMGWLLLQLLIWAFLDAQWEVVFLNMRRVGAGPEYPGDEVWRIELAAYVLTFLGMLAFGFWARLRRGVFILLGVLAAVFILVPIASEPVPEPPIYYYVAGDYRSEQVNFVAEEGQQITFTIDPLTDRDDFTLDGLDGYIANDTASTNNSWVTIAATNRAVQDGNIDPSAYTLSVAPQISGWVTVNPEEMADFGERILNGDFTPEEMAAQAAELERAAGLLRASNNVLATALTTAAEALRSGDEAAIQDAFAGMQTAFEAVSAEEEVLRALRGDVDGATNLRPLADRMSAVETTLNETRQQVNILTTRLTAAEPNPAAVMETQVGLLAQVSTLQGRVEALQSELASIQESWSAEEQSTLVETLTEAGEGLAPFNTRIATELQNLAQNAGETDLSAFATPLDELDSTLTELETVLSEGNFEAGADYAALAADLTPIAERLNAVTFTPALGTAGRNLRAISEETIAETLQTALNGFTQYEGDNAIQIVYRRWTQPFSEGSTESTVLEWEAPEDGWYTFTTIKPEENAGQGIAWLVVDDLEVFLSTRPRTVEREERFGAPPALDCPGCQTATNRSDLRYSGRRTLPQWFSLQLTPYLIEARQFFFLTLFALLAGYGAGRLIRAGSSQPNQRKWTGRAILIIILLMLPLLYGIIIGAVDGGPLGDLLRTGEDEASVRGISTRDLGGIFLTILLSAVGIVASFPVGILLALGRQSELPVIKILCTIFIEVVRGVPLITLLFFGLYILPFIVDGAENINVVLRMAIILTFFTGAYLAEIIRGGLQIIPKGQLEAARAVGLNGVYTTTLIVLPQAIRAVIPAIMGQFVSLLKDTSLVALVGLFEILGATRQALGDNIFKAYQREAYLYIGIVYFILCYVLAVASRRLEASGAGAVRRNQI